MVLQEQPFTGADESAEDALTKMTPLQVFLAFPEMIKFAAGICG